MATFTFDTHRAVKDLEQAGFPEAQAEALIEIVGNAIGESVATKADLQALEQRVMARFDASEQQTDAEFAAMDARFDAFEQRTDAKSAAMEQRIILKLVAILIPCFGLLFAALRFIP